MSKGLLMAARSLAPLEAALGEELAALGHLPPGAVWVLAPTNLAARHLPRRVTRQTGGTAGVEFLTLRGAARRLLMTRLALEGRRAAPAGAVETVLLRLLEGVPDDSYLAGLRRFSNGPRALARAISLLEGCLWTPDKLRRAAGAAARRDPSAPGRLGELAAVWAQVGDWKAACGLFEDRDLIAWAVDGEAEPDARPAALVLYGFYDLNPAQRALVGRLMSLVERCSAYVLWAEADGRPEPGFEYAEPMVRWLAGELGVGAAERLPEPQPAGDLGRLVAGVFGEWPPPPQGASEACFDGSVRVLDCPGETAEAEEAARELLRSADRDDAGAEAGILLRAAQGAAGLLAEAMDRAGVAFCVREGLPLAHTLAGRVALGLLEMARPDAHRTEVVDFLSLARIAWAEGLSAPGLDRLLRLSGITKGRSGWAGRLAAYAERLRSEARRADDEADAQACLRDAELCPKAGELLDGFFGKLGAIASPATWREAAGALDALVAEYAPPDDEGFEPVREAVSELGRLDVTAARPDLERLRRVLSRRLARASVRRGRFQHVGTTLSSIMAARGVTFDVVILPGLVERNFPRHAPQHSLLTELDCEALNAVADEQGCGPLPLQKDRPAEERYLFRLGVGSARRRVVLTYPRLAEGTGRPRMPSHFLADACSAVVGWSADAELLASGRPAGPVRRVPLNRRAWGPDDLALALDEGEYDAATFTGPDGRGRRTGYMAAVSPTFRRAVAMNEARWGAPWFGPYDGRVRTADLLERLAAEYSRFGSAISPTRLEMYARCPFEYFLTYLLAVSEVEAPGEEFDLSPLERGSIVHEALRAAFETHLAGRALGKLGPEDVERALAEAEDALADLGRTHAENHPAVWAVEREQVLDELRALLRHECSAHETAAPTSFEVAFGADDSTPYALSLEGGGAVSFRGRIDRLDRLPDGALEVVDYKAGNPDKYRADKLLGGSQLQLPVYLLAAAGREQATHASARYLMVKGPRDVPQFTLARLHERMDDFRRAVGLIVDGIASGNFFPLPSPKGDAGAWCERYCRFAITCGAARKGLAEMKACDPEAKCLAELRMIE